MIRSPWPSLAPYPEEPAWAHLEATARRLPDKTALIEGGSGRASTFAHLWQASNRVARFLQREASVSRGDRVAISVDGTREFVAAMYGTLIAGAAVVPVPSLFQEAELAAQLADCEAGVLLASPTTRLTLSLIGDSVDLPGLRAVYQLDDLSELAQGGDDGPEPVALDLRSDIALMPYSAGTEGLPKGVMLTHANAVASMYQRKGTGGLSEYGVVLALLPMWASVRSTFAIGATCVHRGQQDASGTLSLIERYRVTHVLARPFSLGPLLEVAGRGSWDLSSLKSIETSGTPLPARLAEEASRRFGCPVRQAYHLMETFGSANRPRPGDRDPTSVGFPVPDTEEIIVDPTSGAEVPVGGEGELLIRGPQVTKGYWRRPAETAAAFLPGGWLHTGDIAREDPEGRVYIVDRAKDMMKVSGRQVAPAEIEAVLLEHPAVKEVAVVPIASEQAGEVPKAFVVLSEGYDPRPDELLLLVATRLAPFKRIKEVEFVPSLPKGPGGKILRRALIQ